MKSWLVPLFLLFLVPNVGAQTEDEPLGQLKHLRITQEKIDQIQDYLNRDREALSQARAEIRLLQAQLSKLLLEKTPALPEAEKVLRSSLDWEYKIRLIQIKRHIEIRKIVGDEVWAQLYRLSRLVKEWDLHNRPLAARREDLRNLLKVLRELN